MFSPVSFNPPSFSLVSFNGAQDESARSGYWRLFYYQLQESELAKRDVPSGDKTSSPVPPKIKAKTPPKPKYKVSTSNPRSPLRPSTPLKRIYHPKVQDKTLPIFILTLQLMSEIRGLYVPIRGRIETPAPVSDDRKLRLLLLLGG